jgi:hypothetical protein
LVTVTTDHEDPPKANTPVGENATNALADWCTMGAGATGSQTG